jgi:hypothetical protein
VTTLLFFIYPKLKKMNLKFNFVILLTLGFFSCKKDPQVSTQTLQLLQNKWSLVSDETVLPTIPAYNSSYIGVATDYYLFGTTDTLTIHQRSLAYSYTQSVTETFPYVVRSNNTLTYGPNMNFPITIKKLTNDTLILTNPITASFINANGTANTYPGTRTLTLAR